MLARYSFILLKPESAVKHQPTNWPTGF